MEHGTLEVIMGCMFSGKSTELINRIRKHKIIGSRMMAVNHISDTRYDNSDTRYDNSDTRYDNSDTRYDNSDTRYDNSATATPTRITSHNLDTETAISTENLLSLTDTDMYKNAQVIFIEEGQFFKDLYVFAKNAVDDDKKHVIVCGLDGDFQRQPIGQILSLVPIADKVDRFQALCAVCKNGKSAAFSKRLSSNTEQELVGGQADYIPVCRYHYLL